ncbi:hypothetical protein [Methylobacterium sp. J-070]|uniref:hypothetical protein n=1 Tax=Methylobacterium sp. J-070 TaxID=2836650 RepID=UPI001FB90F48|nr:hypothetical protein [Methylobacterium sp. J-070]MCJ2050512.1 hypothetical protein [Methylobacterium sp. J-070]
MLRFLAAPAACLILCGTAAAQDMPGLATLSPPDLAQPATAGEAATGSAPRGAHDVRADLGSLALRGAEPKSPPGAPRPWCAQDRRVGTGTGFCLIN